MCSFLFTISFFFQAEDGKRDRPWWLDFRRLLFEFKTNKKKNSTAKKKKKKTNSEKEKNQNDKQ